MQFENTERGDLSNTRPLLVLFWWFFGLEENKAIDTYVWPRTGLFSGHDKLGSLVSHQIHHLIPPWTWTLKGNSAREETSTSWVTTKEKQRTTHMSWKLTTTIKKYLQSAQQTELRGNQHGLVFNSMLAVIPFSHSWIVITVHQPRDRFDGQSVSQSLMKRTHSTANE